MPQSWKITNAITTSVNIVLLDAYTDEVLPKKFFYESKNLDLLRGTTPQDYIPYSKSDVQNYETYSLPATHKDTAGTSLDYTFIIADAQNLEPIALKTINATGSDLADLIITDAILTNMTNHIQFVKDITAFPDSKLAKDFVTALNENDDAKLAAFFQSCLNENYHNLKLEEIHLVQSYLKALPYGWAPNSTTKYFLYASDYRNNTPTDEPIGELVLTNDYATTANPDKSNPIVPAPTRPDYTSKFKAELTTYDQKDITYSLVFKDGTFWDSITTDTPLTALLGSFIAPSKLTMDNYHTAVQRYFVGKVNGYDAFALNDQAPHDQDDEGGFLDLFHPKNIKDKVDLVMYFVTIAMGIGFLAGGRFIVKAILNKGKSDGEIDRNKKAEEVKQYIDDANKKLVEQINPKIQRVEPKDLPTQQKVLEGKQLDYQTRLQKDNVQRIVDSLDASITALKPVYFTPDLQDVMDGLFNAQAALDRMPLEEFRGAMEEMIQNLDKFAQTVQECRQHAGTHLKNSALKDYNDAQKIVEEAREQIDVEKKEQTREEEVEQQEDELSRNRNDREGQGSGNDPINGGEPSAVLKEGMLES